MDFIELNPDQRREAINTQQRFRAWRDAAARVRAYRGSMVWSETQGHCDLMRVASDRQGLRRQSSHGPRSAETERLSFIAAEEVEGASLLRILQRVDKSFVRSSQDFRAVNRHGYLVDLIKPLRDPPRTVESARIGADPDDLNAVEIEGLSWHESAPAFEATAIDARGEPLRMVASDPRVFAAHKFWLSRRIDRDPLKRRRDGEPARAVAALVVGYFPHLPFDDQDMRLLPKELFAGALPLFAAPPSES
jgi:hypothetical protein